MKLFPLNSQSGKYLAGGLLLALFLAGLTQPASAHRRSFVHTYEYQTVPKGETELEWWSTQSRTESGDDGVSNLELRIEFEHGITDRWDMAIYNVLKQSEGPIEADNKGMHFAKTKLETRYRLAERGDRPVDTLLYLEVSKAFGEAEWEVEQKLVFSRDIGKSKLALNLISEVELEKELEESGEEEFELEYTPAWAFGYTTELSPRLMMGFENYGKVTDFGGSHAVLSAIGPTVSVAPSANVWLSATAAFALNDRSDHFNFRFILGIGL
jgi:hypothetical protein